MEAAEIEPLRQHLLDRLGFVRRRPLLLPRGSVGLSRESACDSANRRTGERAHADRSHPARSHRRRAPAFRRPRRDRVRRDRRRIAFAPRRVFARCRPLGPAGAGRGYHRLPARALSPEARRRLRRRAPGRRARARLGQQCGAGEGVAALRRGARPADRNGDGARFASGHRQARCVIRPGEPEPADPERERGMCSRRLAVGQSPGWALRSRVDGVEVSGMG